MWRQVRINCAYGDSVTLVVAVSQMREVYERVTFQLTKVLAFQSKTAFARGPCERLCMYVFENVATLYTTLLVQPIREGHERCPVSSEAHRSHGSVRACAHHSMLLRRNRIAQL